MSSGARLKALDKGVFKTPSYSGIFFHSYHLQQPALHVPEVPPPQHQQTHYSTAQSNTQLSRTQLYIPTLVQSQYDPFSMISSSIQSAHAPPPPPPVSVADLTQHQAVHGQGQGGDGVRVDSDQVLQDFEFENDSTGHSENLSSQ